MLALTGTATAAQTVRLGLVGGIYEDFWAPAKEELAKEGIDLEFVPFTDYVTPNRALSDGDIELNAFQHDIYLQNEIKEYGYKLTNIGGTFIEAMNIFSQKVKSVSEIKDGDTVAIPNDVTNGGRALKVLAASGLITLKESAGFSPTVADEPLSREEESICLHRYTGKKLFPNSHRGVQFHGFLPVGLWLYVASYRDLEQPLYYIVPILGYIIRQRWRAASRASWSR